MQTTGQEQVLIGVVYGYNKVVLLCIDDRRSDRSFCGHYKIWICIL